MPISSEAAREVLGRGASGHVNQSLIDITTSLAFKHPNIDGRNKLAVQELLRAEMLEVAILRHPKIQQHPNIIELEGIAWEIDASHSTILPILVYRKSELGTLGGYIEANTGRLSLKRRLKLCFNVASALETLHSCSMQRFWWKVRFTDNMLSQMLFTAISSRKMQSYFLRNETRLLLN